MEWLENSLNSVTTIEYSKFVVCDVCESIHEVNSKSYIMLKGEILKGNSDGLIGPNCEGLKIKKIGIFCVGKCFQSGFLDVLKKFGHDARKKFNKEVVD